MSTAEQGTQAPDCPTHRALDALAAAVKAREVWLQARIMHGQEISLSGCCVNTEDSMQRIELRAKLMRAAHRAYELARVTLGARVNEFISHCTDGLECEEEDEDAPC